MQVDQLIAELLTRGDMNDDTIVELNRILNDWRSGTVDSDDVAYIEALHARITQAVPDPEDFYDDREPERIEGLTVAEWRDRALRAEAALARIEDTAAART
ncbi:MAG: hypothetical protein ABI697_02080 [Devosia sp.]